MTQLRQSQLRIHDARENHRIRLIIDGDRQAFHALVREYHPLAYSVALKTLNDQQDAEEVVQDAFIKIYQLLVDFRGEASLKTWILRIVLHLSLNRRRDRSRSAWHRLGLHRADTCNAESDEVSGTTISVYETPETLCISREDRCMLRRLVDELPQHLRKVLVLNSFDELSYEEISRILEIPLGTVSSRIYAARRKLLNKLANGELF